MSTTVASMTAEDLLRMRHDGFRYELVRGELRKMSPAGQRHGRIAALLTGLLVQHVLTRDLGAVYAAETGFKLASGPDVVRAPDVAFVRKERVEDVGDAEGFWPGAPDLAVEVISPNDVYAEVEEKVFGWLDAGTRMVVLVNPHARTVAVYRSRTEIVILTQDDLLDGADVVPGWAVRVGDLFTGRPARE